MSVRATVASTGSEYCDEFRAEFGEREHVQPGRGELDSKRQSIEALTDVSHLAWIEISHVRVSLSSSLKEEVLCGRKSRLLIRGEWLDLKDVLAEHIDWSSRCREDLDTTGTRKQALQHLPDLTGEVFAVVEHDQCVARCE